MARRKGWGLLREKSVWRHGGGAQTPLDPRAVREDKTLAVFELRRIGPSRWTPQKHGFCWSCNTFYRLGRRWRGDVAGVGFHQSRLRLWVAFACGENWRRGEVQKVSISYGGDIITHAARRRVWDRRRGCLRRTQMLNLPAPYDHHRRLAGGGTPCIIERLRMIFHHKRFVGTVGNNQDNVAQVCSLGQGLCNSFFKAS